MDTSFQACMRCLDFIPAGSNVANAIRNMGWRPLGQKTLRVFRQNDSESDTERGWEVLMGLLSHRRGQNDVSFLDWVMRVGGGADAKTRNIREGAGRSWVPFGYAEWWGLWSIQ